MPPHHVIERRFKRRAIQCPRQPHRKRDRVGPAGAALQPVQEPQPPLRIRQRDLRGTRHRTKRRARRARRVQFPRQSRNSRRLKQRADRKLHIEARTHPADQARRQQRVAAQFEEVVVETDSLNAQHLGKQRAQDRLLRRAWLAPKRRTRQLRNRQRTAVQLAVRRQRQTLQNNDRGRHHVVGQPAPQRAAKRRHIQRRRPRSNHVTHQTNLTRAVLPRHNSRLRNSRLAKQRRLDLARLDPEPAQLHLRIGPTQELKNTVRTPARQIPGPVHPAARNTIRVRDKPLRRQTEPAQIAPRNATPRYVKLPTNTRRNSLQPTIQYINPRVPDRTANRGRRFTANERVAHGRADRHLGRTIGVDHPPPSRPAGYLL